MSHRVEIYPMFLKVVVPPSHVPEVVASPCPQRAGLCPHMSPEGGGPPLMSQECRDLGLHVQEGGGPHPVT